MKMTVGVVGLGLIGASFAKAYKSDEEAVVYGWNRTKSITQMAQMQGIIDEELTDENLGKCDLVILSLYPEGRERPSFRRMPSDGRHEILRHDLCEIRHVFRRADGSCTSEIR